MARENNTLLTDSSTDGTNSGTYTLSTDNNMDNDILNTDEESITDFPLRSDFQSGMSADVSGGVTSGPDFKGNMDSDTDTGLGSFNESFTIPAALNETETPIAAEPVAEKAADVVDSAKAALATAADTAKVQASQLADQAKTQASALAAQATDKVKEQIGTQKEKAAGSLGAISDAIRYSADSLNESGQAPIANVVTSFATQIDGLTGYLRDKDVDQIASEVVDYAKKNPQVFVGGAFLLGIALARFIKSSNRTSDALVPYNSSNSSDALVPYRPADTF